MQSFSGLRHSGLFYGFLTALAVAALWIAGAWAPLERDLIDARFGLRALLDPLGEPPSSPVVIAIDDRSLAAEGAWPWGANRLVQLLNATRNAGAASVALDLPLADLESAAADPKFIEAIKTARNVILPVFIQPQSGLETPGADLIASAQTLAHTDFVVDADGVVRSAFAWCSATRCPPRAVNTSGWSDFPAMGVAIAKASGADHLPGRTKRLTINYRAYHYRPYYSSDNAIADDGITLARTVSAVDVLTHAADNVLQGRAVVIGITARSLKESESHRTPFHSLENVPSVYIHAALARTIMQGQPVARAGWPLVMLAILAAGMGFGVLAFRAAPAVSAGWAVLAVLAWSGLSGWLFVRASVWLDVLPVWLAIAGSTLEGAVFRYQIIEWNTRRLKERFERYVSPEVAAQLGSDREIELGGQRRRVSVLFADLRGFTRFAEGLPPERTLAVLNRHLRIMSDAVLQHGGTLDKFTGDGLMAFFGAPLAAHDHASRALRAAAAMLTGIERIGAPRLPIGIGIHTGDVVVGNIGSDRRLEYTAIGDTVNVAARLEEAAEAGEILVSEETHAAGGDLPGWHYRQPESLTLKGRRSPLSCRRLVRDDSGRRHPRESASG